MEITTIKQLLTITKSLETSQKYCINPITIYESNTKELPTMPNLLINIGEIDLNQITTFWNFFFTLILPLIIGFFLAWPLGFIDTYLHELGHCLHLKFISIFCYKNNCKSKLFLYTLYTINHSIFSFSSSLSISLDLTIAMIVNPNI